MIVVSDNSKINTAAVSGTLTRADRRRLREATIFHRRRVALYLSEIREPVHIGIVLRELITLRGWGSEGGAER